MQITSSEIEADSSIRLWLHPRLPTLTLTSIEVETVAAAAEEVHEIFSLQTESKRENATCIFNEKNDSSGCYCCCCCWSTLFGGQFSLRRKGRSLLERRETDWAETKHNLLHNHWKKWEREKEKIDRQSPHA